MTLLEFTRRAIAVPFKERGRGWDGWDCWGLVYIAYRECYGRELPDYLFGYKTTKDMRGLHDLIAKEKAAGWHKVEAPEPGDVAVLFHQGRAMHCGLYLGGDEILHCDNGPETCVEKLRAFKIEGFYRAKQEMGPE